MGYMQLCLSKWLLPWFFLIGRFFSVQIHTWRSQWFVSFSLSDPSLPQQSNSRVYDYWVLWPYKTPLSHSLTHTHAHTLARTFSPSASPSPLTQHTLEGLYWYTFWWQLPCSFQKGDPAKRERERESRGDRVGEGGWEGGRERHLFALLLICVLVSILFLDLFLYRDHIQDSTVLVSTTTTTTPTRQTPSTTLVQNLVSQYRNNNLEFKLVLPFTAF